jgi:predicted RNase H-like HicB family nuclease/predicted DNA-binding protein (UPF0251 family)
LAAKEKTRYHGIFTLDPSGHWLGELTELPQIRTFGKTLGKARESLLDALASWLGVHTLDIRSSVELDVTVRLPDAVQESLDLARGAREILDAVTRECSELTAAAALALVDDASLSARDAAALLEISHQRVHQIVSAVHAERRAEEVRQNLAEVRKQMTQGPGAKLSIGQLSSNQALLAVALIVVGGALIAASSSS